MIAGSRIGVYEIASRLGAGGMGEVYRARDTRLGRDVAIKVLPASFAADPDRLARFEREARLLASLSHPNIGAIYGVEESAGFVALVLELVEGETLAHKLQGLGARGLGVAETLKIARQIADALDAAHERGIVHRDLKPANIIVTADSGVKVLDFGLAKESGGAGGSAGDELTHSPTVIAPTCDGVLLGTAPYMSPEQARGKAVDKRTDVWAFGCVLYEMLTGRRAFAGETTSDAIAAILEREPDWTKLPAATPHHIRRLLQRCLDKDPKNRLRDIGDCRGELIEALPGSEGSATAIRPRPGASWLRPILIAATLVLAAGVVLAVRAGLRSTPAAGEGRVEQITFDPGINETPSLSPDGRLLAYAADRAGRGDLDIWVQQMGSGALVRLTDDPADDSAPDFSPDGTQIVFRSDRDNGGIYLMPALGGPARLIARDGRGPRFSPDGTRVAYWTGQFRGDPSGTASALFLVPLAGGAAIQLASDFAVVRDPVWSPDGKGLMVVGRSDVKSSAAESFDLWFVPADGGRPVKTGALNRRGWREAATVGESLTLGSWTGSGMVISIGGGLWSLPLSNDGRLTGDATQLMFGPGRFRSPTASRDGQIVFADSTLQRVVERARLSTGASPDPPVVLYADGNPFAGRASVTRDGSAIVFERRSGRRFEIWQKDLRTDRQQMIVDVESGGAVNPIVSPDGGRIGYGVPSQERRSVTINGNGFVVETSGGLPKPLCVDCGIYEFLSDGHRAVVSTRDAVIQFIDAVTGSKQDVVKTGTGRIDRPSVSPDDRWIAFRRTTGSTAKVFVTRVPEPGSPPSSPEASQQVDEPSTTGRPAGWSPDSRVLYLLLDTDGYRCLWAQTVDDHGRLVGKPVAARHYHDRRGAQTLSTSLGNAITSDGFTYETATLAGTLWRLIRPDGPLR